ncbi:ATP-binding protein [Saccharothrix sp. AJ9571]|nr:ATP-binding protein [Saccharothrix sp. AJ9571]
MTDPDALERSDQQADSALIRQVAASPVQASLVREVLTEWMHTRGLPVELIEDVRLAAYEALANAAEHAYPGDAEGTMTLTAQLEPGFLTVTVSDTGQWRDGPPRPEGGRGLILVRALTAEAAVSSTPTGTTVRMTWPWVQA